MIVAVFSSLRATLGFALAAALLCVGPAHAAAGPLSSSPPSVTGTLQQGKKLTALTGTWVGSGTITYAFQWYRCDTNAAHCSSIHGSTKSTYTEVAKDVGHTIGLTVRATDATGTSPAYSSLAGLVAPPGAPLVAATQPKIDGTATAGSTLTVEPATWTGTPTGTTYAWLRCNANGRLCTPIPSETTASYEPTSADAGHVLVAEVIGTSGTIQQAVLSLGVLVAGV